MVEKSIWCQTKIRNAHEVLYDQETRKNQGMMPNFANEMTLTVHSFFTKIDILYLKRPHIKTHVQPTVNPNTLWSQFLAYISRMVGWINMGTSALSL